MKCPKCEYLGFESSDRCRNCGYEFSLAQPAESAFDLPLTLDDPEPVIPSRDAQATARPALDLDRMIGGPPEAAADLPLFSTPVVLGSSFTPTHVAGKPEASAAAASRIVAALVDGAILIGLDAGVIYFTLRLCNLTAAEVFELPVIPLMAFFLLLNGGYFVAFTAVGGQSIGKMALGIKVVSTEDLPVPLARATLRTLGYLASALPLGAGFLPGVFGADRLALHDRLAHTRVVRPSSI
jgi:uncharacterized RDD family membrane protein YckC